MISKLHQRLGTAGFVLSIIALVAALSGGAYAASGGLSGKETKEVEKIAKKFAGKQGKQGKQGAPGATGPAGAPGAKGDAGAAGAAGAAGGTGKEGKQGIQGPEGESGFTEVLPPEATETGTFVIPEITTEGLVYANFSFNIPLGAELDEAHAIFVRPGESAPAECENAEHAGNASLLNPEAKPGYMCVFAGELNGVRVPHSGEEPSERPVQILKVDRSNQGASKTGAFIQMEPASAPAVIFVTGSWAVTGTE
jgi:hypothetical protein